MLRIGLEFTISQLHVQKRQVNAVLRVQVQDILVTTIIIVRMDMDMVHHITTVINQDIVHTGVVIQYMINIKPYKKWQKSNKK